MQAGHITKLYIDLTGQKSRPKSSDNVLNGLAPPTALAGVLGGEPIQGGGAMDLSFFALSLRLLLQTRISRRKILWEVTRDQMYKRHQKMMAERFLEFRFPLGARWVMGDH